jgi:hypothetical protein
VSAVSAVTTATASRAGLVAPLALAGLVVAGLAYIGLVDPASGRAFVPCPFHELTGWWCPGCGMTRGLHHLLQGDVAAALSSNVFLPLVIAVVAWAWLGWASRRVPSIGRVVPGWVWFVLAGVAAAYGVLRNVPAFAALAP